MCERVVCECVRVSKLCVCERERELCVSKLSKLCVGKLCVCERLVCE